MSEAADILEKAKKRYKAALEGWRDIYAKAKADLDFMSDKDGAMWDSREYKDRATVGRPVPQIDQLTQFKHQVVNDIRMNTPTINVIPASLDSDPKTAEMLSGRIKAIEYKSNADAAYDMAADFSVGCSIGFIRVDRKYIDDDSFDQELTICRVVNPLGVYIDPTSTEPDGSDAKFAFVIEEMSLADFQKAWPDAEAVPFEDTMENGSHQGITEGKISIVEYFCLDHEENEYGLLPDGTKEPVRAKAKYKSTRKMKKPIVRHYKLAGADILEESTFPGKYIPIVPVYGEEAWNNGERHLFSLIRKAKDAQKTFNLWKALETELLLKQQQAPVQAAAGQMRGFEDQWAQPDKAMVLYYNQTDIEGQPAPPPERLQPPTIPTGVVNASQSTANNIREILGMYNASAGKREGDASGVAIKQLEQSSDVGNLHFGDNLVKSITQVGKIIVCALPEIEDTQRIVSVVDKEDNYKLVGINGAMTPEQEQPYNMDTAKFDVRVTTGASYTTQRQQAAELYQNTLKLLPPEASMNVLDLVFKYQDTPGSDALSARFKKMVNPALLDEKDREENAPDPQIQQLQQQLQQITQEAQARIQQLETQLQDKQADVQVKMADVQIKAQEVEIKKGELQLKLIQAQQPEADNSLDGIAKAKEIEIKERKMQLEESQFQLQVLQTQQPKGGEDMGMKDTVEGLQAKIASLIQQEQMEQEQAAIRQQQEQEKAMQEQAEAQAKAMQTQMVIDALSGITAQLGQLTATVSQPITVIRDAEGNLMGAQ